jgi:hypothetical protein
MPVALSVAMNRFAAISPICIFLELMAALPAFSGPPFLTDDPEPVDYQKWEAYLFSNGILTGDNYTVNSPAVELNYGVLPGVQLHLVAPVTTIGGRGMPVISGAGDGELGIKYCFVKEGARLPQAGIFPLAELPTGDADRGLGNGRVWFRLPLWLQKTSGPWTTYGGGGAALNPAPGQRDYPFGGWLVQRTFGKHLSLGGELFAQGRDAGRNRGFIALNFGGLYDFKNYFSTLFSAGYTIAGDNHAFFYFGLYRTW